MGLFQVVLMFLLAAVAQTQVLQDCRVDTSPVTVGSPEDAAALAISLHCSNGDFAVEWVGEVFVEETLHVTGGTSLNITGAGPGAIVDGGGSTQLFYVDGDSTLHFSDMTLNNGNASTGGAIVAIQSRVSFGGNTSFNSNYADIDGGAIHAYESTVFWDGDDTEFRSNSAGNSGGAIYAESSSVSWDGDSTTFMGNSADTSAGAIAAVDGSTVSWDGDDTGFIRNWAINSGGAIVAVDGSTVSWDGDGTRFSMNFAGLGGGAIAAVDGSTVSWDGDSTEFIENWADSSGGAILALTNSSVSWDGHGTNFGGNSATDDGGGAIFAYQSTVSWDGDGTQLTFNFAGGAGGAIYAESSTVSWAGHDTNFSSNSGVLSGGAIHATSASIVSWAGDGVSFLNNSCKGGGGALYLSGMTFDPDAAVFEGNTAEGAGGAVFLSAMDIGPVFIQTNFTANNSPRGGAVYSTSSGSGSILGSPIVSSTASPTTYGECSFADNWASATGGAIESSAGNDKIENTAFEGNTAGVGGALRLGGSAIISGCTFVDNISDEDGGAAVSNVGVLEVHGSRFSGNVFECESGAYLDLIDGYRYGKVCDDCPECEGCILEDKNSVPVCLSQLEHTKSKGGDTTVEKLEVDAGYWRATNTSLDVLACYNEEACKGGITGVPDFCRTGYKGPYCSVCTEGYAMTLSFTCTQCVDSGGGIAIMIVVAASVLGAAIALCMHIVSGEMDGARQGIIHRVTKYLPLQSIKIVVVVWQILTQFASVANVAYPDVYQRFLDGVNVLNFDALWIPSAGCIVDVDFHDRLVMSTVGPFVALGLLAITFALAKHRNRGSEPALQKVRHRHVSMVLLISFLVYSSVSSTVFQTFACEDLDDGKEYLRVDYRIECDSSKHQAFEIYAGIMMFVYPVGIPLFYAYLLYKNRRALERKDMVTRETSSQVQPFSDLWVPYKPERFYYEVIECLRRISLTGVVVFIFPNTAAQVAVTLVIAFSFIVVAERLSPYVSKWDASISLAGHILVFMSMYVALLSKVDVSGERAGSQEVFAGILVAAHACMVVVVVVETIVIIVSMRRHKGPVHREGPRPRVHCKPAFCSLEEPAC